MHPVYHCQMDDYSIKTDNDLFKEYDYFFIDLKYLFDINVELLALDIRVHEIAYMSLVVLVKKMLVINFLMQNTNLVSVLGKICPNFAGRV